MSNYLDSIYTALNNLVSVYADYINSYDLNVLNNATVKNLTVTNIINYPINYVWTNLITQPSTLVGTNQIGKTNFNNNVTQSAGSSQLLDTSIGSITQNSSSVIVQSGSQWNQLKQTQVSDLAITGTLTLPSNIVISGSTYNNDLILNNATIQQTMIGVGINTLGATDFYNGNVRLNNNLTMIGGAGTTATLKNLVVQGTSSLGLITGTTINDLYNTKLNKTGDTVTNITFAGTVTGLSKSNVALGNCDNTTDLLKPVSNATNFQLALKAPLDNPLFSGTAAFRNISLHSAGSINSTTSAQIGFCNTLTSNVQTQINSCNTSTTSLQTQINNQLTNPTITGTAIIPNITMSGKLNNITTTEISFLSGLSSNIQNQLTSIVNTPSVQSITIASANAIASGSNPYITNTGTAKDQLLNFFLPRGADGDTGSKGDKGNTGDDGPQGNTGSPGDATGATVAAGVSAGFAAASAASAAGSAAAAGSSAASAAISTANLALMQTEVQGLQSEISGLQTEIDTLGEETTTIANDVSQLNTKTQYQSCNGLTTTINSDLLTKNVYGSSFSGGIISTKLEGNNILIGTNETLINTITIGGATSITTINGIVNYTNPFNNFFAQW